MHITVKYSIHHYELILFLRRYSGTSLKGLLNNVHNRFNFYLGQICGVRPWQYNFNRGQLLYNNY